MKNRLTSENILVLGASMLGLFCLASYGYYVFTTPIASDTATLYEHTNAWINGTLVFHPYPLYLVIPTLIGLVSSAEFGIRFYTLLLAIAYVVGIYALTRQLNFGKGQIALACLFASIPLLPPYHGWLIVASGVGSFLGLDTVPYILTTYNVAMLLPLFLVLYIAVIRRLTLRMIIVLFGTVALLAPLHPQIMQAVLIIFTVSSVVYRHQKRILAVNIGAAAMIVLTGTYWFAETYLYHTLKFVSGNVKSLRYWVFVEGGALQNFGYLLSTHAIDIVLVLIVVPLLVLAFKRNHANEEFRLIAYSMLVFCGLYVLFIFRISDVSTWITMRMYPFIFPLAVLIVSKQIMEMRSKKWAAL